VESGGCCGDVVEVRIKVISTGKGCVQGVVMRTGRVAGVFAMSLSHSGRNMFTHSGRNMFAHNRRNMFTHNGRTMFTHNGRNMFVCSGRK
jgi:hypothetical protein